MTTGPGARRYDEPGRPALPAPNLPGVDAEWQAELEERITDFERLHQDDVLRGGPGWVPRVRRGDYILAIAANAIIVLWLVIVLLGGD